MNDKLCIKLTNLFDFQRDPTSKKINTSNLPENMYIHFVALNKNY